MTQNTDPDAGALGAPPPPAARPPLRRTRDDRVLGGVAAGFGRWLGVDPVVVRVVLVVLAVFGGSGLLLYAAGWLFIPEEGATANEAQRLLGRQGPTEPTGRSTSTTRAVVIVVAVVLGLILLSGGFRPWHGFWFLGGAGSILLLLAAGGTVLWLLTRDSASRPDAGAPVTVPTAAPQTVGYVYGGKGGYPGYSPPAEILPAPARARSYLGGITLSVALLVIGTLIALDATEVLSIPVVVVLASGLAVLGIGLLVGTLFGRARWLFAIALPLLVATAVVAVLPPNLRLGTEIGDRSWRPVTTAAISQDFRVDIGRGQLDLSHLTLPAGATYPVDVSVGIGELDVVVPAGVRVLVDARVGAGRIAVEGLPEVSGSRSALTAQMPGAVDPTAPTITLTADVGLGNLEVSRA